MMGFYGSNDLTNSVKALKEGLNRQYDGRILWRDGEQC